MTRIFLIVQKPKGSHGDGTATAMFQCALPNQWWDYATESGCYWRNVHDNMADGKTAYERTIGVTCDGPVIPLGAKVS